MKTIKKSILLSLLFLSFNFLAAPSVSLATFETFLIKTTDGAYFEYEKNSLNKEYLAYQIGTNLNSVKMYQHFSSQLAGGGVVTGLKDSNKGYIDYPTTMASYLKAQLAEQPFDINTYFESESIKKLEEIISTFNRVDQYGNILEVTPEPTNQSTEYNKSGTYGPTSGTETISQDAIITAAGVTLQNLTIDGNLIIDEAVGNGEVTLNNVTVSGELRVRGGGKNSIHINGGDYSKILVEQAPDGGVRIVATGLDGVPVVLSKNAAGETLILEGSFDSVTVNAPDVVIKTQGQTSIKTVDVTADAKNAAIDLGSTTTVSNLAIASPAKVTGTGTISKAEIASDNVSFEKAPQDYTVEPGVVVPPVIPTPTPEPPPTPQPQPGGGGGYTPPSKISLSVTTTPTVTLSKSYDSTTATNVTSQVLDAATITGVVSGDTVTVSATATYDNKKAGTAKTITITYTLSGADAAKYSAPANTTVSDGEIIKVDLTLPAPTTTKTKTYDKTATAKQTITPTAGKVNGDVLTVTETATFDTASVGKSKLGTCSYALTGTDAGNYNTPADQGFSSGEIIAKPVKITGTTVETSKTYNRNDVAAVKTIGTSTDIISDDDVTIAANAYYENGSAGTNKPIYVTYTLTGDAAANYQVTYTDPQTLANYPSLSFIKLVDNGVINKVQLTADNTATVADKTYDGTTTASVTHPPKTSGILSGDTVNLSFGGSFANADAGENKTVNINYQITSGSGTENYLPPTNVTATATISPLEFDTTRSIVSLPKEYDGSSTATVNVVPLLSDANVMQIVAPALQSKRITFDIVADYTNGSGNKTSAVGSGYTIAYSFKLNGPDAGNFKLTGADANKVITGTYSGGSIIEKNLTIAPPAIKTSRPYDGSSKVYDPAGHEISSYTVDASQISGLAVGESVAVTANLSSTDKAAGEQTVTISFIVGSDGNSGNYNIPDQTIKVTITPLQLTIDNTKLPAIAATRKYDATRDVYLADNTTKLSDYTIRADAIGGLINSDSVTVKATASYDNKNVGNDKPITIGFTLDGDAAKNYLAPADDTSKTANITRRKLGYTNVNLETLKKHDSNSSANITAAEADSSIAGGMDGVVHHAGTNTLEDVHLGTYNANYYESDLSNTTSATGQHPIVITGTLAGADAGNYVMRDNTVPGKILDANAVISTPYNSTNWSVSGNLTPPSGVANFKLFYAKQAGVTTFYGYDSTGQIYSSTNLSAWTTGAQVTLDGSKKLIGIDSSSNPLAIATTPDTDQYTNTSHSVYYWTGGTFGSWNNYSALTNIQPINPTYYTEGTTDYLIYQDENNNVTKQKFAAFDKTPIGSYPGPSIPSSFTNSLLVYDGNTLMFYAY